MSGHSVEEINNDVKKYIKVFIALLVLTGVTVAVSYINTTVAIALFIGLSIALTKGTLVAGFFMHLFGETKLIFWILFFMLIFFLVLMFLPVLTATDIITI
jgi:cytochrome c oxidase subunit IV